MKHRVVITGIGIIDPLGANRHECFDNLINDFNPLSTIKSIETADVNLYPNITVDVCFPVDKTKCVYTDTTVDKSHNYVKLAIHTVEQALKDAGNPELNTKNVATIYNSLGTSGETRTDFSSAIINNKKRYSPKGIMENLQDYIAGHIARTYQFTGIATSINSACATGVTSIDYARKLVEEYDFVIVGGSDCMVDSTHMFTFQSLQALSYTGSRPFSNMRDGFVMGEGAGCLILESEEKAIARGAKIYAYIEGIGIANDSYSQTSPDPEGKGAELAMRKALEEAEHPNIDFVNAHGTGTPVGDVVEYDAIRRLLPNAPIYSSKAKIGHTMAACGIIELIHGINSLETGLIPATYNLNDSIAPMDKNLLTENLQKECNTFLKNSFGFGGRCASIVISKK